MLTPFKDATADRLVCLKVQPHEDRWRSLNQRPAIAWLTGLSGAGKSSIADVVDRALIRGERHSMVIDGDNLRLGLNRDLSFSEADRSENIRRAAEVARLMAEAGLIVIVSLISPTREDRNYARQLAGDIPFLEIFIDTPLVTCEARDPKGLYRRARAGYIANFTGISAPYEVPDAPNLVISTEGCTVDQSAGSLVRALMQISELDSTIA